MNKRWYLCLRTVRAWLIAVALLVSVPSLLLYTSLSINGKRLLTPHEFVRFTGILSFASIANIDTNGGPRAWSIIGDSVSDKAISQASLELESKTYTVPLPPYTIKKGCDAFQPVLGRGSRLVESPPSCSAGSEFPTEFSSFITTATPRQMDRYITQTLPAAGWINDDRLGSAHFFRKGDRRLMMNLRAYLTVFIADFELEIMPVPEKLR